MNTYVEFSIRELYLDFCYYFPSMKDGVIDYYKSGREELTIEMRGREPIVFHGPTHSIRSTRNIAVDVEEERWRQIFGWNLARRIEERYSNYSVFADKIGVSRVMLSRYINGHATPSIYVVARIANALGCSMTELCDLE